MSEPEDDAIIRASFRGYVRSTAESQREFELLKAEIERLQADYNRLWLRSWTMAHLLYPHGDAPREAVEGDI